ncbi:integral membrane protein [Campylobacter hyointestinalis]|uniref:Integral membrane protein n=1 Tax=Campylobacter hyointestinalis subsp. hyointestinalis TaxID=91352 RepID=A0A9W5AW06_CAMHY|nr:hypothetical protein [Campylobacter hyointestinalis]PPB51387.1 hypothetical protein CDQ68_07805 [Campylobacter hyointestinalis subsp. hyointestinalis]PPB52807.1 hypothetical protein CDQ69_07195 [Campylobacter hyointestinalis subsp. hyointestinalis]PPB62150.1 hypothetical protein CDQ72_03405 [Campylobacter hyointestinalis subsp. hyointestinalis]PPB63298.1 hypothetical protein CDQ73_06160 [Campylobacter hyointestinalis subsp. hyointestinalis]CUU86043.1 integral membrane protein [Campylobacter
MDFNSVLLTIQDKIPKDGASSVVLKDKFENLSQDKQKDFISKLSQIKLKSPAFVFWVGNFLLGNLGVARFMIGDMILGFIRLGLVILDIFIELSFNNASILLVIWIWWIVDLFLVGKKLRKQNFEKIINLMQ